jgi:hypothetical protein
MSGDNNSFEEVKKEIKNALNNYEQNRASLREKALKDGGESKEQELEKSYQDLRDSYSQIRDKELSGNISGYDNTMKQITKAIVGMDKSIKETASINNTINDLNTVVKFIKSILSAV